MIRYIKDDKAGPCVVCGRTALYTESKTRDRLHTRCEDVWVESQESS